MSFFNSALTNGQASTSFSSEGEKKAFTPIPDNTDSKAVIEQAQWKEWEGVRYINLTWVLIDGEFSGRKVFQKLQVMGTKEGQAVKAMKMLAAIDANAGGKLVAAGQEPTDDSLQVNLTNVPMLIKIRVWDMNGKTGNWVSSVSSAKRKSAKPAQAKPVQQAPVAPVAQPVVAAPQPAQADSWDDDDLGF